MSKTAAGPFSQWERAVAGRYLRARRQDAGVAVIAILAIITITVAVAALIVIMSVMNGFRTELLSKMLGFNGHAFVTSDLMNGPGRGPLVARLRKAPGVVQAMPVIEAQAIAVGKGQMRGAVIRGVSRDDVKATPLVGGTIEEGGSLDGFDVGEDGGDIILIGNRLAASVGVSVGDSVQLISPSGDATAFGSTPQTKDYTVGGIFSTGASQYDDLYIYMPLRQAQLFFGRDDSIDAIEIKLKDPDKVRAAKAALTAAAGPGGQVQDWTERDQAFFNALEVERGAMQLILFILVVMAAVNILCGLIMLVKNKGRDIAILRTMGAGKGSILRIFLMIGAAVGAIGSIIGATVGVLFCVYIQPIQHLVERMLGREVFNAEIYFLTHIPARVDPVETAWVLFWTMVISLVGTLPPAWIASRLDPVEALRNE